MSIELLPPSQSPLHAALAAEKAARTLRARCRVGLALLLVLMGVHAWTRGLATHRALPRAASHARLRGGAEDGPAAAQGLRTAGLLRPLDGERVATCRQAAQYGLDLALLRHQVAELLPAPDAAPHR